MYIKLAELRDNPNLMENLRLDLTPEDIFKPRYSGHGDFEKQKAETQGYFFYVEITDKGPELMLMKNVDLKSKTLGEVEGVPAEHLNRVITAPDVKEVAGMFAIDDKLKDWLKEQLI